MARYTHQQRVADQFGKPFWDVVNDFAAQGMNRNQAARAMGFKNPITFHVMLSKHSEADPFPPVISVPARYTKDSGESFRAACIRLAKTHSVRQAAIAIGYADTGPFRHAMKTRGIEVEFKVRKAEPKPIAKPPVSDAEVLHYAQLRIDGHYQNDAVDRVGRSKSALRRHLQERFPDLWQTVLAQTATHGRSKRIELSQRMYAHHLEAHA